MKILFTGGGTAGHVTPNIALINQLSKEHNIYYIGRQEGIERMLIEEIKIPFYSISAGKLRRYLDFQNVIDTSRIAKGFFQAMALMRKIRPDVVFSKGGFVSTPVVWAAYLNRIRVIIHESDMTPGLANKLSLPFASIVCYSFPETRKFLGKHKSLLTGIPIRKEIVNGNKSIGKKLCGFTRNKPVLLVIGGSQGSQFINKAIKSNLMRINNFFNVCHICGTGNIDSSLVNKEGYKQFEYVREELSHLFALSDIVLTRAGATTIFELLYLKKPNVLIPLSKSASRGDQILNANSFKKQGFSEVIYEEELDIDKLIEVTTQTYNRRKEYIESMKNAEITDKADEIINVILGE